MFYKMRYRAGLFTLGILCCLLRPANAQDPEVVKSRVLSAIRRSTLNAGGMEPYRMHAELTTFDGTGKHPQNGTLEYLRGKQGTRITLAFQGATLTYLATPTGDFTEGQGSLPYFSEKLMRAIQQPAQFDSFDVAVQAATQPADELCVAVFSDHETLVMGKRPQNQICLDPANDHLKRVALGDQIFERADFETFDDHEVARKLSMRLGQFVVGTAVIDVMQHEEFADASFTPTAEMKPLAAPATRMDAKDVAGHLLKHDGAKYPGLARAAHIQGVVIVNAIIGKDGRIRKSWVISSPDKLLSEAALKAVNQWTYQPFMKGEQPTEVETTISMNFAIGKN